MIGTSDETISTLYKKGFNNGYNIEQHEPKLLKEVLSGIENNTLPYVQGMRAGAKEHQRELFKASILKAQQNMSSKDNERDEGMSLGQD